jgi:geranylgeranyl pyrophosphate synthase
MLDGPRPARSSGRPLGKDAAFEKSTYVKVLGLEARREADRPATEAVRALESASVNLSASLEALAHYIVTRSH